MKNGIDMGINIKEIGLSETIKCVKKVIEHIRKRQEGYKCRGKLEEFEKPSEYEKCVRTTFVKLGLFTFCSLGLGKLICETYDMARDEEKKLSRRLTDQEIYQIVVEVAKRYDIVTDHYMENKVPDEPDDKGGQIIGQCS